jgi:hypothetical protein
VVAASAGPAAAAQQLPKRGILSGLPWDIVQDEMQSQPAVILAGVLGLAVVGPQDAIRRQLSVLQGQFGRLRRSGAQDEIGPEAPG